MVEIQYSNNLRKVNKQKHCIINCDETFYYYFYITISKIRPLYVNYLVIKIIMNNMKKHKSINVFGEPLETCGGDPITGFYRDNKCNTCNQDTGSHTVCIVASREFLQFSRFRGNDLSTPVPEYDFNGIKPGDLWCLCAARWLEAEKSGMAPKVMLRSTHINALDIIPIETLKKHAEDLIIS